MKNWGRRGYFGMRKEMSDGQENVKRWLALGRGGEIQFNSKLQSSCWGFGNFQDIFNTQAFEQMSFEFNNTKNKQTNKQTSYLN